MVKLKLKNTNFMKNELYMIYNVGINKILVSKVSCGKKDFKCFVGYKDGKKKRQLCVTLPKMSTYGRDFDETKYMSLLMKNDEVVEKHNEIWDKVGQYH